MHSAHWQTRILILVVGAVTAQQALAGNGVEVLLSKIPGHPTAVVPGARDNQGNPVVTGFKTFESISLQPNGTLWAVAAQTQQPATERSVLMIGDGAAASVIYQEGMAIAGGEPNEVFDEFQPDFGGFNSLGELGFTAVVRRDGSVDSRFVMKWAQGAPLQIVARPNDLIQGALDDPNYASGDERLTWQVFEAHAIDTGEVAFTARSVLNLVGERQPVVCRNSVAAVQSGLTMVQGLDGNSYALRAIDTARNSPDGQHWVAHGYIGVPGAHTGVLVHDGRVVIQTGQYLPNYWPPTSVAATGQFSALPNGGWIADFRLGDGRQGLVRDGLPQILAGAPILPAATETWLYGCNVGVGPGDTVILAGHTSSSDDDRNDVFVFAARALVIREGDPVDLGGGLTCTDNAFVGRSAIPPGSAYKPWTTGATVVSRDGYLYTILSLRDAAGNNLTNDPDYGPYAVVRIALWSLLCPGDSNGDGVVDQDDLDVVLFWFGQSVCRGAAGDLNFDRMVDQNDLDEILFNFGSACGNG